MSTELSREHIAAAERRRRIIHQYDLAAMEFAFEEIDLDRVVESRLDFIDRGGNQTDSIWWDWCEGNLACYPSKVLPQLDFPQYQKWFEAGIDPVRVFLEATKKRGLEAFFSYRINGSDNDIPGDVVPMKEAHPDWLIDFNPGGPPDRGCPWNRQHNGYWNFAVGEVQDYKQSILREVAENYDFDGISLDFARIPTVLPHGHQWEHRDDLTKFVRAVRKMLLEVAEKRGRPFLLAARVPESLTGCRFDGMDVETWARERLVDIFVPGVRSVDVDIAAYRRITAGTHIRLYPCHDDHHATDGYKNAAVEMIRGVAANWLQQGADGITTFNFSTESPEARADWKGARQAFEEIGDPATLRRKNKIFLVQRRAGGHPWIFGYPEERRVQHLMYFNSNMHAPLPATLANDGFETLLTVAVGDDVNAEADCIKALTVRVLLSDPSAKDLPERECIGSGVIRPTVYRDRHDALHTVPLAKSTLENVELRLNGALIGPLSVEEGWLVFDVVPRLFALGDNLVGVRVTGRPPEGGDEISLEKLEVHVRYR